MINLKTFFKKETTELLSPPAIWGHSTAHLNLEVGSHQTLNLPTLWSWTSQPPEIWEVNAVYIPLRLWYFCYSSLDRLRHKQCLMPIKHMWDIQDLVKSERVQVYVKSPNHVWLSVIMDCSLPGSTVHGISQARVLEWVAIPFSRGSSWLRDPTQVSCMAGRFFTFWATREARSHLANTGKKVPVISGLLLRSICTLYSLLCKNQTGSYILPLQLAWW